MKDRDERPYFPPSNKCDDAPDKSIRTVLNMMKRKGKELTALIDLKGMLDPNRKEKEAAEAKLTNARNIRKINGTLHELERMTGQNARRALEAEQAGNHGAAVQYALDHQRLKTHCRKVGNIRDTVVLAQTLGENTQAVAQVLKATAALAGSLEVNGESLAETGMEFDLLQQELSMAMEQAGDLYAGDPHDEDQPSSAEGEDALAKLLAGQRKTDTRRKLRETTARLDALCGSIPQ